MLAGLRVLFLAEVIECDEERCQFDLLQQALGGLNDMPSAPQRRHVHIDAGSVVVPVGVHRMPLPFEAVHLTVMLGEGEQRAVNVSHRFVGGLQTGGDLPADTRRAVRVSRGQYLHHVPVEGLEELPPHDATAVEIVGQVAPRLALDGHPSPAADAGQERTVGQQRRETDAAGLVEGLYGFVHEVLARQHVIRQNHVIVVWFGVLDIVEDVLEGSPEAGFASVGLLPQGVDALEIVDEFEFVDELLCAVVGAVVEYHNIRVAVLQDGMNEPRKALLPVVACDANKCLCHIVCYCVSYYTGNSLFSVYFWAKV